MGYKLFNKVICIFTSFVSSILFSTLVYANVSGDMGHFFSSLGYDGNVTKAHAYQGQAAGYYSSGSVYLRNQSQNLQLLHIDTPSFQAGCGGIDLIGGGFSFVNSKEMVQFMKNVMNSAKGYALNLALETVTPEIAHAMQYIQSIAQKINNNNLNSCDLAEDLVGGVWPHVRASQQQICQDIGTQNNDFSDWAAARQGCRDSGNYNKETDKANKSDQYKDQSIVNKNIVWDAIQSNDFFKQDVELSELMMNLTGTYIFDDHGKVSIIEPQIKNPNIIKALLHGGSNYSVHIYTCQDKKSCLKLGMDSLTISSEAGLESQVRKMIMQLLDSVQIDKPLTDMQKGFLNSTSIPILKFITVGLSLRMGSSVEDLTQEADLIARDLLKTYLMHLLIAVQSDLAQKDYTPDVKNALDKNIRTAMTEVSYIQESSHKNLQNMLMLMNNQRILERQLSSSMSSQLRSNLQYSGSSL